MSKRGWIAIRARDDLATIIDGVQRDCLRERTINPGVDSGSWSIWDGTNDHFDRALAFLQRSRETGVRLLLLLLIFIIKQNLGKDGGTVEK